MMRPGTMLAAMLVMLTAGATTHAKMEMRTFPVLAGAGAHDVYPAPDGAVWFTAQSAGKLGHLDPRTGKSDYIALGASGRSPTKRLWIVKRQARVHGRRLALQLGWHGSGRRSVLGCARRGVGGVAERRREGV
jgi:hypothetical protein